MSLADKYPLGATCVFADSNATVSDPGEQTVLAEGPINGEPLQEGDTILVPVFAFRSDGREPTTIYVNAKNIVEVKKRR